MYTEQAVCVCESCGSQWVLQAEGVDDQGCEFCGAGPDAITIYYEEKSVDAN